jgi:hypothetical protein
VTAVAAACVDPDASTPLDIAGPADPDFAPQAYLTGSGSPLAVKFSTYIGGAAFEHARDVTTDAAGNIYVVGGTESDNFPTTAGAYQRVHNPGTPSQSGIARMDAFVMKLSPTGQIIWSTFLGGHDYDRAYAVEVDALGNVYVAGRAGSGFPVTTGAFQTAFRGGQEATFYGPQDGFVCKLNATGSARIYCSYFGTTDPRIVRDLAIDAQGNAYLASSVGVNGLPSTWFSSGFQKTRSGGIDGVVAKINPTGTQVLWATYLGGRGNEGKGENSIRVDGAGNVYFLENTTSGNMPTPNGFDHTLGGSDVYLAKLSPAGDRLLYGTYIGGSGADYVEAHSLAIDGAGNAYVAVTTGSTNFPTTLGALQRVYGGSGASGAGAGTNYPLDLGVVKVSPGGALLAGTYLGGHCGEGAEGIWASGTGDVYVSGGTFSSNYPVTAAPWQNRSGAADAIVTKLAADFRSVVFSERIGGSAFDVGRSTYTDGNGAMYVVGETASTNFPTLNALRASAGGKSDAFLMKLQ